MRWPHTIPRSQNQPRPQPPSHLIFSIEMAAVESPSHSDIPSGIPLLQINRQQSPPPESDPIEPLAVTAPRNPRRPPPPCWSHDETVALIEIYREKWHSLRRCSLKADHWQEIADAVAAQCPVASPPKTAIQCRHKMEKLRKRYRSELRRADSVPGARFVSSWVHFKRMEAMERWPSQTTSDNDSLEEDDEEEDYDQRLYLQRKTKKAHNPYGNGAVEAAAMGNLNRGLKIKIPTGLASRPLKPNFGSNPNLKAISANVADRREIGKKEKRADPLEEAVQSIKLLGDGFVRMEQMKMELAKEIEAMQMDMEMKRTKMILESQKLIVETLARAVSEKKKIRRMPPPDA